MIVFVRRYCDWIFSHFLSSKKAGCDINIYDNSENKLTQNWGNDFHFLFTLAQYFVGTLFSKSLTKSVWNQWAFIKPSQKFRFLNDRFEQAELWWGVECCKIDSSVALTDFDFHIFTVKICRRDDISLRKFAWVRKEERKSFSVFIRNCHGIRK